MINFSQIFQVMSNIVYFGVWRSTTWVATLPPLWLVEKKSFMNYTQVYKLEAYFNQIPFGLGPYNTKLQP